MNIRNGRLAPAEVRAAMGAGGVDALLLELVGTAAQRAVPAISKFYVGAAALGTSGAIYPGCNIELHGVPLSETIHAEQCAIANAAFHGEMGIVRLAVSAAPCGFCRQFLFELTTARELEIILPGKAPQPLLNLLPSAFGPQDLGVAGGLLGSEAAPAADGLQQAAQYAAERSYAPYTRSLAGVAMRTSSGEIFTGFAMENAAFNPALAPMQAAIATSVAAGFTAKDIVAAVIAESTDSQLDYTPSAIRVFSRYCPAVPLATTTF